MLRYLLDDEGFEVREAQDGTTAIDMLGSEAPDCMVLDLMMPDVDGLDVLRERRSRELAPETRILVLTGKPTGADAVSCWKLGADEYLMKPVHPEHFAKEVTVLLARSAEDNERRRQVGLAEARERDRIESAFAPKRV